MSAGFSHAAAELTGLVSRLLSDTDGLSAVVVSAAGAAGMPALGVAVIVATLSWATAHAWWLWHAKIPYVDV